jgi:hypothetical protein
VLPAASLLVSTATLWTALQGTLGSGASVRGAVRNDYLSAGRKEMDIDASPGAFLALREARVAFSLGYRPSFTWRNVLHHESREFLIMHNAYGTVGYTGVGYSLTLSQFVSIGEQSYWTTRYPGVPGAPVDPTQPNTNLAQNVPTLLVANEATSASLNYNWDARWQSTFSASYGLSGGLNRKARMSMPQARSAIASSSTNYLLTREDHIGWDVTVSNIRSKLYTGNGPEYWTLSVTGHWNHTFSKDVSAGMALGATGIRNPRPGGGADYSANLLGSGNLRLELVKLQGFTMSGSMGAGASSAVNAYTGVLQPRLQANANLTAALQRLSFYVNGDMGQSLPFNGPDSYRFFGLGGGASYAATTFLSLDTGYRTSWQAANPGAVMPGQPTSIPRQWFAYLGISLLGPAIVF